MNEQSGYGSMAGRALDVVLVFGGAAAIAFGAWQLLAPAGWIVGGALAAGLGLFGSVGRTS
ncbi:hypothetical protein [Nisaea sediminum]|uniref:hypothetical protein n=1 Tax=Nisaea sediminum TaxID=2775867 RepID=UPI001867B7D9|nr:hypothetical protein [Nisaea sediminum]